MNFVHIHLAINHSPLYATLFAFFFVLIGAIIRNRTVVTAGLIIAIIAALAAIATDLTGDQAAHIIKSSPPIAGLDPQLIQRARRSCRMVPDLIVHRWRRGADRALLSAPLARNRRDRSARVVLLRRRPHRTSRRAHSSSRGAGGHDGLRCADRL